MENKNNNIFLGKIEKSGCYVNNGKYGYFLTCGKKNYKIPEWLEPEEVTLSMAQRSHVSESMIPRPGSYAVLERGIKVMTR